MEFRRRIETFGSKDDNPVIASGPRGEMGSICNLGELTDEGRHTTTELGRRLRHLYVDQLGFMPKTIADADMFYLRCTPIPRALESMQQTFYGFYPPSARTIEFPTPTIITRTPADETLFPNEGNCRRLAQMTRAFAQRAADICLCSNSDFKADNTNDGWQSRERLS
jgi:acid phosphatase